MRRLGLALLLTLACGAPARDGVLRPGDILVLDTGLKAVLRLDGESGDREVLSSPERGRGTSFGHATDLELAGQDTLLVLDRNRHLIFRVDLATGDRQVVLPQERGRRLGPLRALVSAPDGGYWIGCSGRQGRVHRWQEEGDEVEPLVWRHDEGKRGNLINPIGLAPLAGRLFVADSRIGVLELDPAGGSGRLIRAAGEGEAGPQEPMDLALDADGTLLVADKRGAALVRVDPRTGEATTLSSRHVGSGPRLVSPAGLALEASGQVLVADRVEGRVVRIDPASGARRVLASREVGQGPLRTPRRIVVVPGEAPTPWRLGALAGVLLGLALALGLWRLLRSR